MDLKKKAFEFIRKEELVKSGAKLVLGVSGGADSVFLTHLVHALRHNLSVSLSIVHYNHRLRKSSDRDEDFVKELAEDFNIPFYGSRSLKSNVGIKISEDKARAWRYSFFKKIYAQTNADALVLAHHQNDFAETVLMRVIRGSGLLGLRGMQPKSNSFDMSIIRPCLSIKRDEIESYLKLKNIPFCQDETNLNTDYLRNKVRLQLLPYLVKEYNPQIIDTLSDLGKIVCDDYDFLNQACQERIKENLVKFKGTVKIKLNSFKNEHIAMRRMILRYTYSLLQGDLNRLSFTHIQEALNLVKFKPVLSVVDWPNQVRLIKFKNHILVHNE